MQIIMNVVYIRFLCWYM